MDPPHLSLSLSNPKTNQSSSHCRLADPSSGWLTRQFPVATVLPTRHSIALDSVVAWAGNRRVLSDVSSETEVWLADARYEQLLRLSKLLTTMSSLMDGWMDDVCMLLCDEEMEFLPGAMMMTVAETSMS
ncbi:hypothetical protein CFC21_111472 [Triticum aestivum]|uniref:Uncharacterized protein n=2 Tax=Triticum aestivum TaxID=4565 RepID=A0A9R1NF44_WHEAT|nr:hypothetical protein CFC21_111472 [Triticum aestivum]